MEINFSSTAEDAYAIFIGLTNSGVIASSSLSSFCQNRNFLPLMQIYEYYQGEVMAAGAFSGETEDLNEKICF